MSASFSQIIQKIGKGKKAAKTLTQAEAFAAMQEIMSAKPTPEQLGAFLMLLRVREETPEELAGFLAATRLNNQQELASIPSIDLDLGCYAGKRRHLPWLMLSVLLMAQNGYRIFMHGTQEPQSNRLYLDAVFRFFEWPLAQNADQAKSHLDARNFCYMDLMSVNVKLHELIQLRSLFGLRSCANTLARMLNPSHAKSSVHAVYHKEFDNRHIEVASLLQESKVACFRGDAGEIEVNPERPFMLHQCLGSHNRALEFPALLPQWQIKPRTLELSVLPQVWSEQTSDTYGEAAVIGTSAVFLTMLEGLDADYALLKAQELWQNRERTWPAFNS